MHTGTIETACPILTLSWNQEGTRLLTGGEYLQLWHCKTPDLEEDQLQTPSGGK